MTDRELRLRLRIDRLQDERDRAQQALERIRMERDRWRNRYWTKRESAQTWKRKYDEMAEAARKLQALRNTGSPTVPVLILSRKGAKQRMTGPKEPPKQ